MQWKVPDNAGVAELNGGDTAGKERELDRSPSGSKQWKAVRSSASEGLEIRRIFFGGLRFRFVFNIVAMLWIFHLVSVFRVSSGFSVSLCCRVVVVQRVCF